MEMSLPLLRTILDCDALQVTSRDFRSEGEDEVDFLYRRLTQQLLQRIFVVDRCW